MIIEYKLTYDEKNIPHLKEKKKHYFDSLALCEAPMVAYFCRNYLKMAEYKTEHLCLIGYDKNDWVTGCAILKRGDEFHVNPNIKDIMAFMLLSGSEQFLLVHNHPIGSALESDGDSMSDGLLKTFSLQVHYHFVGNLIVSQDDWSVVGDKKTYPYTKQSNSTIEEKYYNLLKDHPMINLVDKHREKKCIPLYRPTEIDGKMVFHMSHPQTLDMIFDGTQCQLIVMYQGMKWIKFTAKAVVDSDESYPTRIIGLDMRDEPEPNKTEKEISIKKRLSKRGDEVPKNIGFSVFSKPRSSEEYAKKMVCFHFEEITELDRGTIGDGKSLFEDLEDDY